MAKPHAFSLFPYTTFDGSRPLWLAQPSYTASSRRAPSPSPLHSFSSSSRPSSIHPVRPLHLRPRSTRASTSIYTAERPLSSWHHNRALSTMTVQATHHHPSFPSISPGRENQSTAVAATSRPAAHHQRTSLRRRSTFSVVGLPQIQSTPRKHPGPCKVSFTPLILFI